MTPHPHDSSDPPDVTAESRIVATLNDLHVAIMRLSSEVSLSGHVRLRLGGAIGHIKSACVDLRECLKILDKDSG